MTTVLRRTFAVSVAASALLFSMTPDASAQDDTSSSNPSAATSESDEDVIVTGSRTSKRSRLETSVPVDVVTGEDLERTGALGGDFGQALQNAVPSFYFPRQSNSGVADIVRPAQLRGLSPDQVLVLVNGKRRHTTSTITLASKTGRGTSPVDFNSIALSSIARIEVLRDGAGAQYGSDAIAGVINVILDDRPDRIEITSSVGAHFTDFEPQDRSITDGETVTGSVNIAIPVGDYAFLRVGAEYRNREETARGGIDGLVPGTSTTPANLAQVGKVNFRPGDSATDSLNLWFNTGGRVSPGIELYAFGTYDQRYSEGAAFYRYPDSRNNVIEIYPDGHRPIPLGENEDFALTAGLRSDGDGPWSWDISASYGENDYLSRVKNSLNPSLGPTSPTEFTTAGYNSSLIVLNADAAYDFLTGDIPVTVAGGIEYRRERFASRAGDPVSYEVGPFASTKNIGGGLRPADTRREGRDIYAAFGEISAELTPDLFVSAALRYEDYSDFGDNLSAKFSARWEFADGFAIRGSIANSFRAPSLIQQGYKSQTSAFSGGGLVQVSLLPTNDPISLALGAGPLDPETAISYSAGFTARFSSSFDLTIDAYRVDVDDRITISETIRCTGVDIPPAAQALCAVRQIRDVQFFTNGIDARSEGVDIVATYRTDAWDGALTLTAAVNFNETTIRENKINPVLGFAVIGIEETNTITDASPKQRVILTADWRDDTWSVLGRLTYQGDTTRVFNFGSLTAPVPIVQPYDGKFQLDTEIGYRITEGAQVYIGASNLLDEYPDLSSAVGNYGGNLPYDVLSPIGFNGRYVYGGVRLSF